MTYRWILGASDPEMDAIERLLFSLAGSHEIYVATLDGRRVLPYQACRPDGIARLFSPGRHGETLPAPPSQIDFVVECFVPHNFVGYRHLDHHREGDRGYGRPPIEFLSASSIGQVISEIAKIDLIPLEWKRHAPFAIAPASGTRWTGGMSFYHTRDGGSWRVTDPAFYEVEIPKSIVLAAAADHCLAAAYQAECPGVRVEALSQYRLDTRATFLHRAGGSQLAAVLSSIGYDLDSRDYPSPRVVRDALEATIRNAEVHLRKAPIVEIGGEEVRDLRAFQPVPELPEAAVRNGLAFLARPPGTPKIVLQGAGSGTRVGESPIRDFLGLDDSLGWAEANGYGDVYGDPVRGFAGAFPKSDEAEPEG